MKETQCNCPEDCGSPPASEAFCSDGIDNDCDGVMDCADTDCAGTSDCPCNNDGTCNEGEDCYTCPNDCPSGSGGSCEACFKGKCDGICNPKKEGPDCADCASYCCGLDTCDPVLCGEDCGAAAYCGDGSVDSGEECDDRGESAACNADCTWSVCGDSISDMTDPAIFEADLRQGLDILTGSPATKTAEIHLSSLPDIYWLWVPS